MAAPLEDDIALRIGLAARVLPGVDARLLLRLLIRILGEPISSARLQRLRASRFRQALQAEAVLTDPETVRCAFDLLKGQGVPVAAAPVPVIESGVYCELSGSVRVACASDSGERIDGTFSGCSRFLIYQVSPDYIRLIDIREPAASQPGVTDGMAEQDSRNGRDQIRATLIKDCAVLYTVSIGGPAAAKVVRAGLHPIKLGYATFARDALTRLQTVLAQDNPPPWLAKAMGSAPRLRAHYCEMNA